MQRGRALLIWACRARGDSRRTVGSGAEEPEPVAQAEDPGERPADSDPPADPAADPAAPTSPAKPTKAPPAPSGIEEIIVKGAESEAASDFEAADSVTGFGAEDLAALGAQDIADLAAFTPNLEIVTAGATTPTFFIRGVGLNDFNSNSTGAVAIYQDDVPINAPALQLGTLFDIEAVNVLRGPQGTGLARNSSAGAIKIYSRKPTGEFGGFLRSELGNYDLRDFEGAVEAPIYEDLARGSPRVPFHRARRHHEEPLRQRPAVRARSLGSGPTPKLATSGEGESPTAPWSICGETVERIEDLGDPGTIRHLRDSGGPRGQAQQPQQLGRARDPALPAHARHELAGERARRRRDELSRLGQSIGTAGDLRGRRRRELQLPENGGISSADRWALGGHAGRAVRLRGARDPEALTAGPLPGHPRPRAGHRLHHAVPRLPDGNRESRPRPVEPRSRPQPERRGAGDRGSRSPSRGRATSTVATRGPTKNDTCGGYLKGDIALPYGMQLTTITGYDTLRPPASTSTSTSHPRPCSRSRPTTSGWQGDQDSGSGASSARRARCAGTSAAGSCASSSTSWSRTTWASGQRVRGRRSATTPRTSGARRATRAWPSTSGTTSRSTAASATTGSSKKLDYVLSSSRLRPIPDGLCVEDGRHLGAPTGTIRLTYRFREDTHAYLEVHARLEARHLQRHQLAGHGRLDRGARDDRRLRDRPARELVRRTLRDRLLALLLQLPELPDLHRAAVRRRAAGVRDPQRELRRGVRRRGRRRAPALAGRVRERPLRLAREPVPRLRADPAGTAIVDNGQQIIVNRELQNTGNPLLNSPAVQGEPHRRADDSARALRLAHARATTGSGPTTTYYDATEGRGHSEQRERPLPAEEHHRAARLTGCTTCGSRYRPPDGRIEIAGWVRNLTNQSYKTFAFDASTFNETTHLLRRRAAHLRRHPDRHVLNPRSRGTRAGSGAASLDLVAERAQQVELELVDLARRRLAPGRLLLG